MSRDSSSLWIQTAAMTFDPQVTNSDSQVMTADTCRSFQTGVPLPFELFFACEVGNATLVENRLFDAFGDHRVSRNREFLRIAPERVKAALQLAALREIRLGDEVFETAEDKADVVAAKRRSRFLLSMIGIKPGTELQLAKNSEITCKTVDDRNQVEFNGEVTSLSNAALQAFSQLGFDYTALSGPWEWTHEGKRLDEIRRDIQEKAD